MLPAVRAQVDSQIKVRDLSKYQVAVQPAEFASWSDARAELMVEAKRPLKAQLQGELAASTSESDSSAITANAADQERAIENEVRRADACRSCCQAPPAPPTQCVLLRATARPQNAHSLDGVDCFLQLPLVGRRAAKT